MRSVEDKAECIKHDVKVINAALGVCESILSRQRNIEDPTLRYSMFVDKLLMFLDIGIGLGKATLDDDDYPDELKERFEKLSEMLTNDLNSLMKWIQNPVYSPDHPYGNSMMKSSENNFNNT